MVGIVQDLPRGTDLEHFAGQILNTSDMVGMTLIMVMVMMIDGQVSMVMVLVMVMMLCVIMVFQKCRAGQIPEHLGLISYEGDDSERFNYGFGDVADDDDDASVLYALFYDNEQCPPA